MFNRCGTGQRLPVFPLVGQSIEGNAVNAPVTIADGDAATFTFDQVSKWLRVMKGAPMKRVLRPILGFLGRCSVPAVTLAIGVVIAAAAANYGPVMIQKYGSDMDNPELSGQHRR